MSIFRLLSLIAALALLLAPMRMVAPDMAVAAAPVAHGHCDEAAPARQKQKAIHDANCVVACSAVSADEVRLIERDEVKPALHTAVTLKPLAGLAFEAEPRPPRAA